MNLASDAIGVFDSGLGGLTSVKHLKSVLPNENIIYFGDTGRVPYGTRSAETIKKYADEDIRFLLTYDIKAVLVACGTVSSTALDDLKKKYPIAVFGVIDPAARKAVSATKNNCIAILGTPATIKNGAYEKAIKAIDQSITVVSKGCPLFVPLVENGYIDFDNQVTRLVAKEYLSSLGNHKPDVIILGCTHYPIIKDIIEDIAKEMFGDVTVIDSGACAAEALKSTLSAGNLLNNDNKSGKCVFFVSDDVYNFKSTANIFLGENPGEITKVNLSSVLHNSD